MTGWKFDQITSSLRLTNVPPPSYRDKFHKVRALIAAWNKHMTECFIPGWVSCLDESMSVWTSKWTCPGFMYVPCKPHPMGNEYHSICCGMSEIMYAIELVEGKDEPEERKNKKFSGDGKTAGLLLRLCEGIFGTGKVVVLDSGFCVLQALVELKKMGVYASALVKKRQYWPKYVDGDAIAAHFEGKAVGTTERLPGVLDGEKFDLFAMKDEGYVMTIMSTYGSLMVKDNQKESVRALSNDETGNFKYTEVIANHFDFRGAVDFHNSKRHDCGTKHGLSLEETWRTTNWTLRVFSFVLAITEVNAFLAYRYYSGYSGTQLEFRKRLAHDMIYNGLDVDGALTRSLTVEMEEEKKYHKLVTCPPGSKWIDGNWKKVYQFAYQQVVCSNPDCNKRVRTVCACSPSIFWCKDCYTLHLTSPS